VIGIGIGASIGSRAFSPGQLGSALALWVEADRGVATSSTKVTTWADQSGNARSPIQGTDGKRPILVANGIGALPCIRFDGSDDFLAVSGFTLNQPYWTLLAHKYTAQSGPRYFLTGADYLHPGWYAASNSYLFNVDCATGVSPNVTMPTAAWHILDCLHSGSSSVMGLNGVRGATFDPGSNACNGLCIGEAGGSSGFASIMDVYGVVILNRAPTTIERSKLLHYFARKIGVTIS